MILSAMSVLEELLERAHEENVDSMNSMEYDLDTARVEDELQEVITFLVQPKRIGRRRLQSFVDFLEELKEEEKVSSRVYAIDQCKLEVIETYYKVIGK